MNQKEKDELLLEKEGLEREIKTEPFVDPYKVQRIKDILSILIRGGVYPGASIVVGKMKKSRRVTSFTRDHR